MNEPTMSDYLLADCVIKVADDVANPQPLILNANNSAFVFPHWDDTSGNIVLQADDTINLYCPQGLRGNSDVKLVRATCIGGKYFQIGLEKLKLKSVRCARHPWITVLPQPENHKRNYCHNRSLADIGFNLVGGAFLKTMTICHDLKSLTTHFTTYHLQPFNVAYQRGVNRLNFIQAREFNYSVNFNRLYSKQNQQIQLDKLLSSNNYEVDDYYDSDKLFFSRGHLGGKVDFFFANHQRSTFFYLNVAPQWQAINGGNWQRIEDGIRRFIALRMINVTIVSGTHEVLRFPSLTDEPLYLGEKQLPVPQYFYKMVYDETGGKAIVFISINNPHIDEVELADYIFCENIIDQVKWVSLRDSITMGFIFACDVNEFMEEMPENLLPQIKAAGLLV